MAISLPAIENLAGTLAQSGRFDEAESYFRRSLELAPDDNETRYLLARVLIELGRTEDARTEVERILRESDPEAETRALQQLLVELDG